MSNFPLDPTDGTPSDDGRYTYYDPPGAWKVTAVTSTDDLEQRFDAIDAELREKITREQLDAAADSIMSQENRVQVVSDVTGVTQIDLSLGTYVKVVSTLDAWQPKFINWPGGDVE